MAPTTEDRKGKAAKRHDLTRHAASKTNSLSASMAAMSAGTSATGITEGGGGRQHHLASVFAQFSSRAGTSEQSQHLYNDSERSPPHMSSSRNATSSTTLNSQVVNQTVIAALKKMSKRSDATRIKGIEEFSIYMKSLEDCHVQGVPEGRENGKEPPQNVSPKSREKAAIVKEILGWLPEFCRVYRANVLFGWEKQIRSGLNVCLETITKIVGRDLAPFLRSILPMWWLSCHDSDVQVSRHAKSALSIVFPEDQTKKRADAFEYCRECMTTEVKRLLGQSEGSLHLDLYGESYRSIPVGIREERYDRVIAACLVGLSEMVALLGNWPDLLSEWTSELESFFSSAHPQIVLYRFLTANGPDRYRPSVRKAGAVGLSLIWSTFTKSFNSLRTKILPNEADTEAVKHFTSSCLGVYKDTSEDVQEVASKLFVSYLRLFPETFQTIKPDKLIYPHLLSSLRHNFYSSCFSDLSAWNDLIEVVSVFPFQTLLMSKEGLEFFRALCPSVLFSVNSPTSSSVIFASSQKSSEKIFLCYFQILIFLCQKRLLPLLSQHSISVANDVPPTPAVDDLPTVALLLFHEILEKWFWCPIEIYFSLTTDNHFDIQSRVKSLRFLEGSCSLIKITEDQIVCIPSLLIWAYGEQKRRGFPNLMESKLQSILKKATDDACTELRAHFQQSNDVIRKLRKLIHFFKLFEQQTAADEFLSSSIQCNLSHIANDILEVCKQHSFSDMSQCMKMNPLTHSCVIDFLHLLKKILLKDHTVTHLEVSKSLQTMAFEVFEKIKLSCIIFDDAKFDTNWEVVSLDFRILVLKTVVECLIEPILLSISNNDIEVTQFFIRTILDFTPVLDCGIQVMKESNNTEIIERGHFPSCWIFQQTKVSTAEKELQQLFKSLLLVDLLTQTIKCADQWNLQCVLIFTLQQIVRLSQISDITSLIKDSQMKRLIGMMYQFGQSIMSQIKVFHQDMLLSSEFSSVTFFFPLTLWDHLTEFEQMNLILRATHPDNTSTKEAAALQHHELLRSCSHLYCNILSAVLPILSTFEHYPECRERASLDKLKLLANQLFQFLFESEEDHFDVSSQRKIVSTLYEQLLSMIGQREAATMQSPQLYTELIINNLFDMILKDEIYIVPFKIQNWKHLSQIILKVLPVINETTYLGLHCSFWNFLIIFKRRQQVSIASLCLHSSSPCQIAIAICLSSLAIVADQPSLEQGHQISFEIKECAVDLLLSVWMGFLASSSVPKLHPSIASYLRDSLLEFLMPRMLWTVSDISLHLLMNATINLLSDFHTIQSNLLDRERLEMQLVNQIILFMIYKQQDIVDESKKLRIVVEEYCHSCLQIFNAADVVTNENCLLQQLWDMQTPRSNFFVLVLLNCLKYSSHIYSSSELSELFLLDLRDQVYIHVVTGVDDLSKIVSNLGPGTCPDDAIESFGTSLIILSVLMELTDEGGGTTSTEESNSLVQTSQSLIFIAESLSVILSCGGEQRPFQSYLNFVESLSIWCLYLIDNKNTSDVSFQTTILLLLKDSFLLPSHVPDSIQPYPRLLLSNSIQLVTSILKKTRADIFEMNESMENELLIQICPVTCQSVLFQLHQFDDFLSSFQSIPSSDQIQTISDFLMNLLSIIGSVARGKIGRTVECLEGGEPPFTEIKENELMYLVTQCTVHWRCPVLKTIALQAVQNANFPWLQYPLFQISKAHPLYQLQTPQPSSSDLIFSAGPLMSQFLNIIEETTTSLSDTYGENSQQQKLVMEAIVSMMLGDCFGGQIAKTSNLIDTYNSLSEGSSSLNNKESYFEECQLTLNIWIIILTSLAQYRFGDITENDYGTDGGAVILDWRTDMINKPLLLFRRLQNIAIKIQPVRTSNYHLNEKQLSCLSEESKTFSSSDHQTLISSAVELCCLIFSLAEEIEFVMEKNEEEQQQRLLSSSSLGFKIPVIVKSQQTFLKRTYLKEDQAWILGQLSKISSKISNQIDCIDNTHRPRTTAKGLIHEVCHDVNFPIETAVSSKNVSKSEQLWLTSARLLLLLSQLYPVTTRNRITTDSTLFQELKACHRLEHLIRSVVTPRLLHWEINSIKQSIAKSDEASMLSYNDDEKFIKTSIKFDRHLKQLKCRIAPESEEVFVEFEIVFHESHPLRCPSLKCVASLGVPKSKIARWIFLARRLLLGGNCICDNNNSSTLSSSRLGDQSKNEWDQEIALTAGVPINVPGEFRRVGGSVASALLLLKEHVYGFLTGLEDCSICYSTIHHRTRSVAKMSCNTCKYKFHSECLQKWFRTSHKSSCPLCQSDIS